MSDNRIFLQFNMTFGQELIVLHRTPPMFGKFWCMLGNSVKFLNKEHSLLVH